MREEEKREVAAFRFGIICDLVNRVDMEPGEKERLIREKCARKWQIPFSEKTRISRSTILRWVRLYKENDGHLECLYPRDRSDQGECRAMDEETALALIALRKEMPGCKISYLIEQMKVRNLISAGTVLKPSTVYRFLHRRDLIKPVGQAPDRRKFEAELPNDLWQSDVMHGPMVEEEGKMRKSYLIAFLDDHSRLVPYARFYLSERLELYLDALQWALLKRGLPRKLYVDNGPAFRSRHLEYVTAALGITLIHSKPYKPQGRGKIERLFRTIRNDFLVGFKGNTLSELNEAFDLWLTGTYHQRRHGGTGQSPFERFSSNTECLRAAPENLRDYFRQTARRRVAKDRTITLGGKLYEGPVELIGSKVELLYHPGEPDRVEIRYNQKSYGFLRPVDLHVNCRVKRDRNRNTQMQVDQNAARHRGGRLLSIARRTEDER
jgi:transposase InsO family protein